MGEPRRLVTARTAPADTLVRPRRVERKARSMIWRTLWFLSSVRYLLTVSAVAAAFVAATAPIEAFGAGVCPQFVTKYCVYNSAKVIFTAEINPCLAKQKHWTIIYAGQCRFRR